MNTCESIPYLFRLYLDVRLVIPVDAEMNRKWQIFAVEKNIMKQMSKFHFTDEEFEGDENRS